MESKKIKISIKEHSKSEGHIEYILLIEIDGHSFKVPKRYSELKTLNDSLRRETNSNNFPKFPPKKFFGFVNEDFINKRQQELNTYFEGICNSSEFSSLPSFLKFMDDCKQHMKGNKSKDEKKEEPKNISVLKKTMSDKTTIDRIREKLRPEKRVIKKLSNDEKRAMEDEFNKIVEDCNKKYIAIDFEVELHPKQKSENYYLKIINEDKDLGNKDIKENVEPGVDDNFNLISQNNNIDELEKDIKQKMEAIINKGKEIEKIYDIKEILKTL